MSKANKLISAVVLICFIFSATLSDIAFAQTFVSGANTDTLAIPSRLDDISGVEHKDIGDIEIWFTACITYLNEHGWEISPLNIIKFKSIESSPSGNVLGKTIFQMPGAKFLVGKMEDLGDGKLRIKVNRSGRMYYAEFSPAENGTVTVYPAGKTPARNTEDALAIEAYKYHERLDEVIAFAHKKGLAKEPFKGKRNFKSVLRKLYEALNIEVVNPDPGNLFSIGDRNLVFIPLTAVIKEELKKREILSKNGECPVTKIAYEGKLRDVLSYMTSSNRAIHVFVPQEIYDVVAGDIETSDGDLTRIELYLGRHLAHEIGVICGSAYSVNGVSLKNTLDERYDSVSFNSWIIPSEKMTLTITDLDHVKGRDYAAGSPAPSSEPAEDKPESQKIIRKPGKSPKDVFTVMAATKRFWHSEFSMFDYIKEHKAYAQTHEGWDPDFSEADFKKIFQTNNDSFLRRVCVITSWGAGGELRFKLTPLGRNEAGIGEMGGGAAASPVVAIEDDNGSFECERLTVTFNVLVGRKDFPFTNSQIIAALRPLAASSEGNLDNIIGRDSIRNIQFGSSGVGSVTGYVVVLDKIGTRIELCVKAKGLPENLITGTITAPGQAASIVQVKDGSITTEGLSAITALSQRLFEHDAGLRVDGYREYTNKARTAVTEISRSLKFTDVRDVHKKLLDLASGISKTPDVSASEQRKKEAQAVSDIISAAAVALAEEFPQVLEASPTAPSVIAPKIHATAAPAALAAMPAVSGPSQSAITSAERSFDALYASEQRSGVGVISLQYLQGVARDVKAGLLQNRLEKVFGLLNRVKASSKNPACKAMASQVIADYNRIAGNPTGMMKPPTPATAAQSVTAASGIEIIRELRKKLEAFIAKTPSPWYRRYGEKALKATEKHERMAQGSAQERENVYRELKELKIVLYVDYVEAQGFARARRDAIREVRDIAEDGEWAFEKYLKTIPAPAAVVPPKSPATRNNDGTFARKPGKSPEDALKVIAATPKLQNDYFALSDYIEAYKIEAPKNGWDPNIADNTARNDLYVNADSLLNAGYIEITNPLSRGGPIVFRLTQRGRDAIAGGAIQTLRNTVMPLTAPVAARISFAPGPNDITDIEMAPNIRFMIGNIIGQYDIRRTEYNFQLLEAVRTGFIATRGEALPRLEEILPSSKIGMADVLYDQLVGMRAMAMMDSPAPAAGSAGKSEVFGERYAELALMPGLTLFRYQEAAGKPTIVIRMMAHGRVGTFRFGEVTEIAAFAERNGSLRKVDVPVPCVEIIRFIMENAGDSTVSVLAMKKTTTINIASTGTTITIKDGKMNVSRGMIMGDQSNAVPVLPTPAEITARNAGKAEPAPDAIGPDTGFTSPGAESGVALTGDLERGKTIIRQLQANLYEFIDRNQENQDATVALLAVRDGLIASMREGYNPETVYQRLYELYREMDANGEVAGIISESLNEFAANFTEAEPTSVEMKTEEVPEEIPVEEFIAAEPAKDMALPSIVSQGESELDRILGLVPVDWIDGSLDAATIRDVVKEAIPSNTLPVADNLWDGKLGLIFSETVTFGELLNDGSYDDGLGILLPNIVRSGVRVAVIATTDKQRALIEEINAQILDPEQKIVCGATIDEARLGLRNSARFCYFKAPGEKDAIGMPTIAIIVKRIIDAIGKVMEFSENAELMSRMHEAARRFAEAA